MQLVRSIALGSMIGASSISYAQLADARTGVVASFTVAPIGSTVNSAIRPTTATYDTAPAVAAGASPRVERAARCDYQPDGTYYEPVYRDGHYYCEQRSSAAVGVSAGTEPR